MNGKPRARCGTPSGYASHYYHGERPCEECKAAQAAYSAEYRRRRKNDPKVRIPESEIERLAKAVS